MNQPPGCDWQDTLCQLGINAEAVFICSHSFGLETKVSERKTWLRFYCSESIKLKFLMLSRIISVLNFYQRMMGSGWPHVTSVCICLTLHWLISFRDLWVLHLDLSCSRLLKNLLLSLRRLLWQIWYLIRTGSHQSWGVYPPVYWQRC